MTIYGTHSPPFEFEREGLSLRLIKGDRSIEYSRVVGEEEFERTLVSKEGKITLHPVEPLNLPKELTSSLLIEFENPIVIDSKMKKRLYTTFPVEIATFFEGTDTERPLDIFSLSRSKYTLYGDVKTGTICKYWSATQSTHPPEEIDPIIEGLLELTIVNRTEEWKEVTKVVFNAYGMKIYFDEEKVGMKGRLYIKGEDSSETGFSSEPISEDMAKAREIYRKKRTAIDIGSKFVMESGI